MGDAADDAERRAEREQEEEPGRSVVVQRGRIAPVENITVEALGARMALIDAAMEAHMVEGVHYGKVPGVGKPTLLKPGAEMLCVLFKLDPEPKTERTISIDGHLDVWASVTLYAQDSGVRIATGEAMSTTRETRHAFVEKKRVCPECGGEFINKSKQREGEWYCFRKIGGCGANFSPESDGAREIAKQDDLGRRRREEHELADQWNTVLKMAVKRAHVAATLSATGASAKFTQDVEDQKPEMAQTFVAPDREKPVPNSWPQVDEAMQAFGEETAAAFGVYLRQAAKIKLGTDDLDSLTVEQRRTDLWRLALRACVLYTDANDTSNVTVGRREMEQAWAPCVDGVILEGPPYRIGGEPENANLPSYAVWLEQQMEEADPEGSESFEAAVAASAEADIPFDPPKE